MLRKNGTHLVRASVVRSVAGLHAKKISGRVPAVMNGTLSIQPESAPHASISGLKLSAYRVVAGRRIRSGIDRSVGATVRIRSGLGVFRHNLICASCGLI